MTLLLFAALYIPFHWWAWHRLDKSFGPLVWRPKGKLDRMMQRVLT